MKWETHVSIERYASDMAIKFDLGRDLDLEFSKWDIELAISPGKKDCHETK